MASPASRLWDLLLRMATASTTLAEMHGNGSATGIARTITANWQLAASHAIRRDRNRHSILPNLERKSASSAEDHFFARISTAVDTSSVRAAKARSARA